jgi:hypothetical protein
VVVSRWQSRSAAGKRRRQAGGVVIGGVRAVREDVLGGAVLRVGLRRSKDGWSGLSAVARFGRSGTAVVEWSSSRECRQGGPGSSRHRCAARGSDKEFRVGPGWRFTVAQRWPHDDVVAAKGRRRKRATHGEACSFKACTRRWPRAAETVGETAGGSGGDAMGGQRGGHGLNAVVMVTSLFGPCG